MEADVLHIKTSRRDAESSVLRGTGNNYHYLEERMKTYDKNEEYLLACYFNELDDSDVRYRRGDKIRDNHGLVHEVYQQVYNTVYLVEGGWIHRTKCWPI